MPQQAAVRRNPTVSRRHDDRAPRIRSHTAQDVLPGLGFATREHAPLPMRPPLEWLAGVELGPNCAAPVGVPDASSPSFISCGGGGDLGHEDSGDECRCGSQIDRARPSGQAIAQVQVTTASACSAQLRPDCSQWEFGQDCSGGPSREAPLPHPRGGHSSGAPGRGLLDAPGIA